MFWTLLALLAAGCAICWVISGSINKQSLKDKMRAEGVNNLMLNKINNATNQVSFTDLYTGKEYTCEGDEIGDDIYEGQVITV